MEDITQSKIYNFDDDGVIISQTDTNGIITFVNKKFREVSGYDYDELIGKNHNIIRHPDMPKAVFTRLWETIQNKSVYSGIIKNLRKDGKEYWINLEILPLKNKKNDTLTGFISVARNASKKDIQESEILYKKMLEAQKAKENSNNANI